MSGRGRYRSNCAARRTKQCVARRKACPAAADQRSDFDIACGDNAGKWRANLLEVLHRDQPPQVRFCSTDVLIRCANVGIRRLKRRLRALEFLLAHVYVLARNGILLEQRPVALQADAREVELGARIDHRGFGLSKLLTRLGDRRACRSTC